MRSTRFVRRTAVMAVAGLLAGAVTACSSTEKPEPVPTSNPGPVLLTFSVYGPPPVVTAYAKIAADFTAANPDVVVNVRPYDTHEESDDALLAGFENDRAPDVFLAERSDLSWLQEGERLERVDQLLVEREVDFGDGFQREALEAFSGEGALLCMPVDTSPLVVYYNTRLVDLEKLSGPGEELVSADTGWSFEQFAAAARQSSRGRFRGVYVEPTLDQIAPFVWSAGGHMIDDLEEPTTLQLSDGDSEAALESLLEVVRDPALTFGEKQIERVSAVNRFKQGRLAMLLGHRDLTPAFRAAPGLSFDVMPVPRMSRRGTSGTMRGLCVNSGTDRAEEVADFIAFAVSDEPTEVLAQTGYVTPTNIDVANSEAFVQPGEQPENPQVFTRAVRYVQRLPLGDGWDAVEAAVQLPLTRLFYDPLIDPLGERLAEIDALSAVIFERFAPPEETEESEPSDSPSVSPSE